MNTEELKNEDLEQEKHILEEETLDNAIDKTEEDFEQEIDEQEQEIIRLQEELAASKDAMLRKAAELENVRKRVQRERVALYEDAKIAALQDVLPISEDLFRVVQATNDYEVDSNFQSGVKLVADKFEDLFKKYGVEIINNIDIPFDVNLHDALLKQPAPDSKTKSDTVLQVLENGYKIGDKVIKHAKVIVSE